MDWLHFHIITGTRRTTKPMASEVRNMRIPIYAWGGKEHSYGVKTAGGEGSLNNFMLSFRKFKSLPQNTENIYLDAPTDVSFQGTFYVIDSDKSKNNLSFWKVSKIIFHLKGCFYPWSLFHGNAASTHFGLTALKMLKIQKGQLECVSSRSTI